jgi:hypothetical protein
MYKSFGALYIHYNAAIGNLISIERTYLCMYCMFLVEISVKKISWKKIIPSKGLSYL